MQSPLTKMRAPRQLVENRISFAGPESEFSIYDTYHTATGVGMQSDQLLYCGMITGRKILHDERFAKNQPFLPHESYVMAPGERIEIDFPDASEKNPTTCLTIEISKERVSTITDRMIDRLYLTKQAAIETPRTIHTHHTTDTQQLLDRLASVFTENHPDRDIMVDLGISELVVRLLRQQERDLLLRHCHQEPDTNGLTAAVDYIKQSLAQPLDMERLAKRACMSRSKLYAEFKESLGCSPRELQLQLRLNAAAELIKQGKNITHTCYDTGFSSPSHFSRRFSQQFGCSPRTFQNRHQIGHLRELTPHPA